LTLKNKAEAVFALHLHEGEAKLLYDVDDDPDTATFNADGFSTFVLLYQSKEVAAQEAPAEVAETEAETVSAAETPATAPDTAAVDATPDTGSSSGDSDMWRVWVLVALMP